MDINEKKIDRLLEKVPEKVKDYTRWNVALANKELWLEYYIENEDYYKNFELSCVTRDYDREQTEVGIYRVVNLETNKSYIGLSRSLSNRKYEHFGSLKKGRHLNKELQEDYNNLGSEYFKFEVLENCKPCELEDREIYYHEQYYKKGIPTYSDTWVAMTIPRALFSKVKSWVDEYKANKPK